MTANLNINIITIPAKLKVGKLGKISVIAGNFGNDTIVSNSMRITVSAGDNCKITSLSTSKKSDSRWTVLNLSKEKTGNTIVISNTGKKQFESFDISQVLLNVKAVTVKTSIITANISYITGVNPFTGKQSAAQGNLMNDDDNSITTLQVI